MPWQSSSPNSQQVETFLKIAFFSDGLIVLCSQVPTRLPPTSVYVSSFAKYSDRLINQEHKYFTSCGELRFKSLSLTNLLSHGSFLLKNLQSFSDSFHCFEINKTATKCRFLTEDPLMCQFFVRFPTLNVHIMVTARLCRLSSHV